MATQLEPTRQRASAHLRVKPERTRRPGGPPLHTRPSDDTDGARVVTKQRGPASKASRPRAPSAQGLLFAFVIGILVMTVAVVVTNAVGHWWILIPVMCVDLAVTFGVVASIVRLLDDGGDDGAD
jgi:hypothetical protein